MRPDHSYGPRLAGTVRPAAVLALVAVAAAAGCGPSAPDENDAMALMTDMAAIYNAGADGSAFASLWTEDGDFYSLSTGAHWQGRAAVDSAMSRVFERRNPASDVRLATERVRVVGRDLALVDAILSQDDVPAERMALVLVPVDGEWKISAARAGRVPVD